MKGFKNFVIKIVLIKNLPLLSIQIMHTQYDVMGSKKINITNQ